jgi:hypothetical protein
MFADTPFQMAAAAPKRGLKLSAIFVYNKLFYSFIRYESKYISNVRDTPFQHGWPQPHTQRRAYQQRSTRFMTVDYSKHTV